MRWRSPITWIAVAALTVVAGVTAFSTDSRAQIEPAYEPPSTEEFEDILSEDDRESLRHIDDIYENSELQERYEWAFQHLRAEDMREVIDEDHPIKVAVIDGTGVDWEHPARKILGASLATPCWSEHTSASPK